MGEKTLLLFAHGAGAGTAHPWMQGWARRLASLGTVVPFDYPYMQKGRRAPDRLPKLIVAHREALAAAREAHPGAARTVLIGKSMGSRVGCHLANEEGVEVDACVCLGYPLKGIGKTSKIRDEVLLAMRTPALFCQGSKDRMGPLDLFAEVRAKMTARNELFVVDGGDHGLKIGKRNLKARGIEQEDSDAEVLEAIRRFLG